MRILFLTLPYPDYVSDTLFHGLRTILGADVVDFPYQSRLYKGGEKPVYGRGFTAWNLLDEIDIERSIDAVLKQVKVGGHFDVVVVNASMYETLDRDYMEEIFALWFEAGRLDDTLCVMIDGGDHPYVSPSHKEFGKPILFKRENEEGFGLPISISIPKEKITPFGMKKTQLLSKTRWDTKEFNDEVAYYESYKEAFFAYSPKKAGWDCMRHYEIMANGCIPLISDYGNPPILTATSAFTLPGLSLPRIPHSYIKESLCVFVTSQYTKEVGSAASSLANMAISIASSCSTESEATRFIAALRGLGAE